MRKQRSDRVSEEEALNSLKKFVEHLGRKPKLSDFYKNRPEWAPSDIVYRRRFGTISNALNMIGIDCKKGCRYSDKDLKEEFLRVSKVLGKAPTKEEFDKYSKISSGRIVKRFGWNNLIKEFGLEQNQPRYTKEEVLEHLKKVYKEEQRCPNQSDFENRSDRPNFIVFYDHFGSFNNALKEIGIKRQTIYIAKDGHKCLSVMEQYIDDWLFNKNIKHQREIFYPKHCLNPNGKMRCDFVINGMFVEFFGLHGKYKNYTEKENKKEIICRDNKIKLLCLYPKDLRRLDKIFI